MGVYERVEGRSNPSGERFIYEPTGGAYAVRKGERIVRDKNLQMTG